ncbi:MAG: bifunctional acetate--CoA ligase family protein/GNAT family N-acetyltransferase [Bryobacterales bacterium]|nr:bifunctional acetate--CoA ligase family protein/GNAT family N-acetyltransferase [Bryobacterales bacterium]
MAIKNQSTDPATSILGGGKHPLESFFSPSSVALIGATENEGTVGRTVFWNLISNPFGGMVFPVNPKRASVLGIKAYPNVAAVPGEVELAVITTPAPTVPGLIRECVDAGIRSAIVISAGFKEIGSEGAALEQKVLQEAKRGKMRIIGPNCLGLMSPLSGLNATFAHGMALPGSVGFISQSGALCTAVLDWSVTEKVGFSAFISIGSMSDIGWGDLIDYLGNDPRTRSILIYMESIGDARSFLSAAREVALTKPIIVIKAGRTEAAAKAAASHTGSLTGSDEVLDAAFRRSGVLRVKNIADLFYMAEVLAKQPRPKGNRMAVITNAGGPAVLAADALTMNNAELAMLTPETVESLNQFLPPAWSHNNPVDILGDAKADRYAQTLDVVAKDPNADGFLVILTPQAMTDATGTAELLRNYARLNGKPVLASWMGGGDVANGVAILNAGGIPTFPYPDTAARAFGYMYRYTYNLRGLYETPVSASPSAADLIASQAAERILTQAIRDGRQILTEFESKELLAAYGLPVVRTVIARSMEDAVRCANEIGYPVVLKLYSETITHKSDVGGVKLNLQDERAVQAAFEAIQEGVTTKAGAEHFQGVTVQPMVRLDGYELIIGSSLDPQFGPVLLFGAGGTLVEVFRDRALALPPLTSTLARRLMEQTRIYTALQGVRGRKAVDFEALEQLLVRFSRLVAEQPRIKEIDVNPLLVSESQMVALDARVVLHPASMPDEDLPRLAVRPYPMQYVQPWTARNGLELLLRPIRPEDEPLMVAMHQTLSERTVYLRYLQLLKLDQRIAHERLQRICFLDFNREMAIVAEGKKNDAEREILAVGRLRKDPAANSAEFAVLVTDAHQGIGLGTELLKRLIQIARDEKLDYVAAEILAENFAMQRICEKLGFKLKRQLDDDTVTALLKL